MKNKNTTLLEHLQNPIEKLQKEAKLIDTPNTQIHDRSRSWLGTGISIQK